MKLTKKQQESLQHLRNNFHNMPRTESGGVITGLNTTTLNSLCGKGVILCDSLHLGGVVVGLVLDPTPEQIEQRRQAVFSDFFE